MAAQASFRINDRVIHPAIGTIVSPLGTVRLEPRVMDLLTYLARNGGRVVSRQDIIRDVWRDTLVTDDVITRSISQIRRALSEDWRKNQVIETIPKRGYRLLSAVEPVDELAAPMASSNPAATEATATNASPEARPSPAPQTRRFTIALIALLLLCAVAVLGFRYLRGAADSTKENSAPGTLSSVMIASFVRTDAADATDHLASELSTQLIDALAGSPQLRVIGPASSDLLAHSGKSALEGARDLNVAAVVTGTVRLTASQLLVSVSLLDSQSGRILHGHDYQFPKQGALAASESIAQDVARMLGVQLRPPQAAIEPATASPEAFQLFLEARDYLAQNKPGAVRQGIDFLRQAIKEDASFAEAHAALAVAIMLQADFGNSPISQLAPEAQGEINKAFELRPKLAQAYAGQGLIYLYTGRLDEAADALRHATALRPNYAQAHIWLGLVAQSQWQVERSIASYERALAIEPLSSIAILNLCRALDLAGSYERAESQARAGLKLYPGFANLHWALAHILWNRGDLAGAEEESLKAVQGGLNASTLYGQLALLSIGFGNPDESREWILRGERLERDDEFLWLAKVMHNLASHSSVPLRSLGLPESQGAQYYATAAIASLDFYHRDFASASRRFAEAKLSQASAVDLLNNRWLLLAGHSPALDEAAAHLLGGDAVTGKAMLRDVAAFIAKLRADGLNSPGLDYEEAAIASLESDVETAATKLATARQRGWREEWFLPLDPKMSSLRTAGAAP